MKYFLIALAFIANASYSQQKVLSTIPANGAGINVFIPKGYDTLGTAKGDLNKDGLEDIAMVLASKKEGADNAVDPDSLPSRLLIVLLKKDNKYELAGKSDSAILCKGCGGIFGDPFEGVSIERGLLIIYHYGGSAWRWALTHKFRYQNNDFFLIGKTTHSYWDVKMCDALNDFAGTDYEDVNLVTGRFEKKKISENCKLLENKKGKKAVEPLLKLSDFAIDN